MQIENPSVPSIRKCPHSVYWPADQPVAYGCGACNPPKFTAREDRRALSFSMPVHSNHALNIEDDASSRANNPGACPRCGSKIHYGEKKMWECAECGNEFPAPKTARAQKPMISTRRIEARYV